MFYNSLKVGLFFLLIFNLSKRLVKKAEKTVCGRNQEEVMFLCRPSALIENKIFENEEIFFIFFLFQIDFCWKNFPFLYFY